MAFQWRRFAFFDKDNYTDDDTKAAAAILNDLGHVTAAAGGRMHLVFANAKGVIRIVDREFGKQDMLGYDGEVTHMCMLKRSNLLLTIGDDATQPTLKIWSLDKLDSDGNPFCAKRIQIFNSKFPQVPILCFAVLEDLSQCAIALATGAVMLYDGNILKDKTPKQSFLIKEGQPITGLHYREDENYMNPTPLNPNPNPLMATSLYVITPTSITTYYTKNLHHKHSHIDLDYDGAQPLCSTLAIDNKKLVIGRKEGVYYYEVEEKSICFGFEGTKKLVGWYSNYLVLVSEGIKEPGAPASSQSSSAGSARDTLTVYDLKNKFIAYQTKVENVTLILPGLSSLFILTTPTPPAFIPPGSLPPAIHTLIHLIEKDLSSKMDLLFKKNLYTIAISLAQSSDVDRGVVLDIYQMYGDHLYSKGDYEGSITQYIETIGYTEPSYVIRKFLDAQRIHNLTRYLESLHSKGKANTDHTTLLLNCYTKLKEVSKLDEFVKGNNEFRFDVITAIGVCRQAGYYEHALYLAERHQQHELYLKIQLEDVHNAREALKYIQALAWTDADRFITEYGKTLVTQLPAETTEVLMELSTHWVPKPLPGHTPNPPASAAERSKPEDFIHFFVEHPIHLQQFLEKVAEDPKSSPVVFNTLLELYLRRGEEEEKNAGAESKEDRYNRVHPYHHNIMNLLKSPLENYDVDHALVLCKTYSFEKGILYLYAKLKFYHEIVAHHMEMNAHAKILKACKKYGAALPQLWVQALSFFAANSEVCEDEITQVLENIERLNLLPPLMVVQMLAANPNKPLAVVKDYIIRSLKQEQTLIIADQQEIARYQHDTQVMREEIQKLQTQSVILFNKLQRPLTFQSIKCHACGSSLSLPALHFLCMHSFHQRCLVDGQDTSECPKCAPEYRKVREIKSSMKASATQHDRFYKQLEDATDGFGTVAEYFGRGIFEPNTEEEQE